MRTIQIILVIGTALLLSCSDSPRETQTPQADTGTVQSQAPAQETELSLSPAEPTVETFIILRINSAAVSGGEIHWYVNGMRELSSSGYRFSPVNAKKGDVVQASLISGDREYRSNEVRIMNSLPIIQRSSLQPVSPRVNDVLKADIQASDADEDPVSFEYRWSINGVPVGEGDYLETDLKRGDAISVEITPYDGDDSGRSVILTGEVQNSLPAIVESDVPPSFEGNLYQYRITATDPDGDALTYTIDKGPEGMTIDSSSGLITWEAGPDKAGTYELRMSINDNNGGILIVPITTTISFQEEPAEGESANQKP